MINITELANFLSINIDDIDNISKFSNLSNCSIYITIKRKHTICPSCHSESSNLKEWKIKKISHPLFQNKKTILFIKYPNKELTLTPNKNKIIKLKKSKRGSYKKTLKIK